MPEAKRLAQSAGLAGARRRATPTPHQAGPQASPAAGPCGGAHTAAGARGGAGGDGLWLWLVTSAVCQSLSVPSWTKRAWHTHQRQALPTNEEERPGILATAGAEASTRKAAHLAGDHRAM